MNARLLNEGRNGLTVGTGIYAAFGKNGVVAVALLLQSPSQAGWQGVALYMLNISLVPRRGGGGERAPGTHCLRMRVIIGRSTW